MAKRVKRPAKDQILEDMGEELGPVKSKEDDGPYYRIMGEAKVPVAKAFGKSIERRKAASLVAYEFVQTAWNEAYRYYNHNQVKDTDFREQSGSRPFRSAGNLYENIVFSNVSTMIPAIYAKNPDVSFNTDQDEDRALMQALTKAVNALFKKKPGSGGVNLKPRMKKAVLHSELTNMGILKLEYIKKDPAQDKAQEEMGKLVEALEKADNSDEVREIEGQMKALESQMELFEPSGFRLNTIHPHNLIIDVFAENEDGSDAWWMMEKCFLPTDWLNARFTKKDDQSKERTSVYKPTHKVKWEGQGNREDMLGNVLETVNEGIDKKIDYMDEQRASYIYQNMTECWYYWDRTTRRIYLFADNDWTWPIWVWDDDIGTSRFFPYHIFQIVPSTGGVVSPGEVSYYLDQQDELNTINEQIHRIRRMVFNFVLYNKNKLTADDAAKLVAFLQEGRGNNAIGVDVPEGMAIKDAIEAMAPPSVNYKELFDKQSLYQAIDKLSSVSDAIRGTQFKTNTVKSAVDSYQSAAKIRIGNRTDAIEDCVADLAWTIAEIMISTLSAEDVKGLIGDKHAKDWKNMSITELNATTSVQVAAGSSEKPTSAFKKEEAVNITQAIGQFAKAAPAATLKIMLKLLKGAFPELDISEEDWDAIDEEASAMLGKGQNVPGAMPRGTQGANPSQPGQPDQDLQQILSQLPPQVQQMVVQAVKQGATPQQALQPILEKMNGRPQ